MTGFEKSIYALDGFNLVWPDQTEIEQVSLELAKLDPWKHLKISSKALAKGISKSGQMKTAWVVKKNDDCIGIVTIKPDWLLGPYLNLVGLLPEDQGLSIGTQILDWMQREAQISNARNLYLCVSDFNHRAQKLYRSFGFIEVGKLDALICNEHAEILMRKSLS